MDIVHVLYIVTQRNEQKKMFIQLIWMCVCVIVITIEIKWIFKIPKTFRITQYLF